MHPKRRSLHGCCTATPCEKRQIHFFSCAFNNGISLVLEQTYPGIWWLSLFLNDNVIHQVKTENPGIAFTEINAVISKKWNSLDEVWIFLGHASRCSALSPRRHAQKLVREQQEIEFCFSWVLQKKSAPFVDKYEVANWVAVRRPAESKVFDEFVYCFVPLHNRLYTSPVARKARSRTRSRLANCVSLQYFVQDWSTTKSTQVLMRMSLRQREP